MSADPCTSSVQCVWVGAGAAVAAVMQHKGDFLVGAGCVAKQTIAGSIRCQFPFLVENGTMSFIRAVARVNFEN